MKELSIAEKARAYDEAIKRAKVFKEHLLEINDKGYADEMDYIFPELKESEDERIKEALIEYFRWNVQQILSDFDNKEVLAWLEKQGSQDNAEDVDILHRFSFYSYKDEPNVLYLSGLYVNEEYRNKGIGTKILEIADEVAKSLNCHAIRLKTKKDSNAEKLYRTHGYNSLVTEERDWIWLEKQGEKEFTFKSIPRLLEIIEPTDRAKSYCQKLIDSLIKEGYVIDAMIVGECLKQMNGEDVPMATMDEQKPANKVEPKFNAGDFVRSKYNKAVVLRIEEVCNDIYKTERGGYIRIEFQDDWELMEQNPAEWSEEDEQYLEDTLNLLEGHRSKNTYGDVVEWLKSLRPQSQWKPSEGQLECLSYAIEKAEKDWSPLTNNRMYLTLKALEEQLKKLREE